ncbi:DUF6474 family protein [Tsukamurella soli]|uniref:DUF6474 family protein n=1 Tax=Tsukamurella soli TaxID=644556 RepID=A0ABP8JL18_9ACTN
MGLFRSKKPKTTRAQRRAEARALKAKAKLEARLAAKNQAKRDKSGTKADLTRAKVIAKMQGKSDKNALKIAELDAKAAVEGKLLSQVRIKRYISTARLLAPVVAPVAYRAAAAGRNKLDAARATRLGVPVTEVAQYTGHGGALAARIDTARASLTRLEQAHPDAETKAFTGSVRTRLDDLASAVATSSSMPTARRRTANAAVSRELDGVEGDLLNRLGVSS